jgi:two-component system, NarL family, response regulator
MPPITVLVTENQPLTRLGLKALFASVDDIDLLGDSATPEDGFRMFREMKPDVTLLGLRFPGTCTIDDLEKYLSERPAAKIIILAEHAGDNEIKRALNKGAVGYILKDVAPGDLLDAVRAVHAGRKYIPAEIAGILSEAFGQEELTAAETSVLQMIVGGMSNKEIAFALDITENTVKSHVQNIFGKLGVSDRTSAARLAIKRGLVRTDI